MFNRLKCFFGFYKLEEVRRHPSQHSVNADYVESICGRLGCNHLESDLDYKSTPAPAPSFEWEDDETIDNRLKVALAFMLGVIIYFMLQL